MPPFFAFFATFFTFFLAAIFVKISFNFSLGCRPPQCMYASVRTKALRYFLLLNHTKLVFRFFKKSVDKSNAHRGRPRESEEPRFSFLKKRDWKYGSSAFAEDDKKKNFIFYFAAFKISRAMSSAEFAATNVPAAAPIPSRTATSPIIRFTSETKIPGKRLVSSITTAAPTRSKA